MGWAGPKHYCNIEFWYKYLNINAIQQYENIMNYNLNYSTKTWLQCNNGIYNNKHTNVIHISKQMHNTLLAINNCVCHMQNTIARQHCEIINAIKMGDCNTQTLLHISINAIHNSEYNTQRNMLCIIVLAVR